MKPELTFLYIYLTDECNLSCIHCWQSAPLAGRGEYSHLKLAECKKFLNDTIAEGLRNITFSGGEPLLNTEFHKFAEYFNENNIHMSLETNGMLIEGKILNTIKKCNVYCAVSLDGVKPETHNKQRANKYAYQKTVQGIAKLEKAKIPYQLIMAISKFNYDELDPLLDWAAKNCKYCNKFKINIVNPSGRAGKMDKKGLLFNADEVPIISDEVAALIGKYPIEISLHVDPAFVSFKNFQLKYTCGGDCGYLSSLSILANGNVSICSMGKQVDKYVFGHVSTIDVKDAWGKNTFLNDMHENTHTKLKGICSNCIFRKQCLGGCRALALSTYGDFFAPHPRCQAYYDAGKFPASRLILP
jgi:SynChlorMet cassette radical SAM/SPASM protein ScmF